MASRSTQRISPDARRATALAAELAAARAERDRETDLRRIALEAAERLRSEVVWLQARVEELEVAAAAHPPAVTRRGLASLIPDAAAARQA
ncbi:MAG: hypothetical protein JJD92_05520 [Frankiaceae bacterium]|nr:hypothetical protein [Frankiaceae bacterium]